MPVKYVIHSAILSLLVTLQPVHAREIIINDYYLNNPSCERGETTIPGMWMWDIDKNWFGSSKETDLWWNHISKNERALVPVNGAYIKLIGQGDCQIYGPYDIMRANNPNDEVLNAGFSKNPIKEIKPLSVLLEDTVFAIITNQGKLARLCIRGFRSNQDYNFREAYLLDKPTTLPGRGSERHYYHIKLDWTIFRGFDLMPYMESPE